MLSPVVGVIGSLQALETVKLLSGFGETAGGALARARRADDADEYL